MTQKPPAPPVSRAQRTLAYMMGAILIITVLSLIAIPVATGFGVGNHNGFSRGIWPAVLFLPQIGLPLTIVLLVAIVAINFRNRARINREAETTKRSRR